MRSSAVAGVNASCRVGRGPISRGGVIYLPALQPPSAMSVVPVTSAASSLAR
jgi:hypothetical protein